MNAKTAVATEVDGPEFDRNLSVSYSGHFWVLLHSFTSCNASHQKFVPVFFTSIADAAASQLDLLWLDEEKVLQIIVITSERATVTSKQCLQQDSLNARKCGKLYP